MSFFHPLDSISFIAPNKAPQSLLAELGNFELDPAIPLPVQNRQADESENEDADITSEMILAGVLTIFAYDNNNEHTRYYKKFLLRARPKITRELADMALRKAHNDDFELAEEICLALKNIAPNDSAAALSCALVSDLRGESYRRSGLHDDADACDENALALYKQAMRDELPDAYFSAAVFFLRKQDFPQAKDCFETFLALAATMAQTAAREADEIMQKKIERAVECLNMISAQNLDDALFKNAYTLISSGQEEKGITAIKQFLEKNTAVWNAWFLLGWGLRLLQRYDGARQAFLQALGCEGGENADTHNELAICCMELELFKESEKHLKTALNLSPEDSKLMSNMGALLLRTGKKENARTWFLTALEYNPDDTIAKHALASIDC